MSSSFRATLEVLRFSPVATILTSASLVSSLWSCVSSSSELWLELMEAFHFSRTEVQQWRVHPKLCFQASALLHSSQITVIATGLDLAIFDCRRQRVVRTVTMSEQLDCFAMVAVVSHWELFVSGGAQASRKCAVISLLSGARKPLKDMHDPRFNHSAVSQSNTAYVFGGTEASDTAECVSLATMKWRKLPNKRYSHSEFTACVERNSVYLCGGNMRECEQFRIDLQEFHAIPLQLESASAAVCFFHEHYLVCIARSTVVVWDGVAAVRRKAPEMMTLRGNMSAVVSGNKVYVPMLSFQTIEEVDMESLQSKVLRVTV